MNERPSSEWGSWLGKKVIYNLFQVIYNLFLNKQIRYNVTIGSQDIPLTDIFIQDPKAHENISEMKRIFGIQEA